MLKTSRELRIVRSELADMAAKAVKLERSLVARDVEIERLNVAAAKVEGERNKLRKMVREQTGADLLVNALKAVGLTRHEKKTLADYQAEAGRLDGLRQQASGMRSLMSPYATGLGAPLGL